MAEKGKDALSGLPGTDRDFVKWQEEDLASRLPAVMQSRKEAGLDGLVGNLEAVVITTEPPALEPAAGELLAFTGLRGREYYSTPEERACVLGIDVSPSVIVRSRHRGQNPFLPYNRAARTKGRPNTRLETFIFRTEDIKSYVDIQRERGVLFMTEEIREGPDYSFIQTVPSRYTGNSIGFIEWTGSGRSFAPFGAEKHSFPVEKPSWPFLSDIFGLDHTATRVRAADRNAAICEFLGLTNYHFDFAVFVRSQNSITSVARRNREDFAMVFTSGIAPPGATGDAGPTEKFIHEYGTRVHHMAFSTENIDSVYSELVSHGMEFLVELVGSKSEGLKQTFTMPSSHTLLVTEYIHRYGGFDGFFTKSNVEKLTRATGKQVG